jgi:pimeloyl-ACP methyl ester carboxylesterase
VSQLPRVPVLILPGWKDRATALRHLVRGLIANGWPPEFVTPIQFDDPFGSNIAHAAEVSRAIDRLRDQTGAQTVDVIAHSMGGLALRWALADAERNARQLLVRRAVFLGTPHRGTWIAWLGWGEGAREMRPGSAFLRSLSPAPLTPGVDAFCVRTRLDARVIPGISATLPEARTYVLSSVTHRGMLRNERVLRFIVQQLQ